MEISIGVDLANVEMGFPVAPAGEYGLVIVAGHQRKKEGKEFPYIAWELVGGFERDGQVVPIRLWQNTSLSPKAAGLLKGFLVATALIGVKDSCKSFRLEDLIGRRVKAVVSVIPRRTGEGNMNNIERILKLEEGSPLAAILSRLPEESLLPSSTEENVPF